MNPNKTTSPTAQKLSVSVVLGSYNRWRFLKKCISSVRSELTDLESEIIVVDGGSTDGALQWLLKQKDILTIVQHNRGQWMGRPIERKSWSYFMNLGFKCARGKYICMVSDDCLLVPGAIKNGVLEFERHLEAERNVGALAFYYRDWPEEIDYRVAYAISGTKLRLNHGLYLAEALASVGWCDEITYKFYYADGDLSLRLWEAGYEVLPCPKSFVEHFAAANSQVRRSNEGAICEDRMAYEKRWGIGAADSCIMDRQCYVDTHNTVSRFPLTERVRFQASRLVDKVRNC